MKLNKKDIFKELRFLAFNTIAVIIVIFAIIIIKSLSFSSDLDLFIDYVKSDFFKYIKLGFIIGIYIYIIYKLIKHLLFKKLMPNIKNKVVYALYSLLIIILIRIITILLFTLINNIFPYPLFNVIELETFLNAKKIIGIMTYILMFILVIKSFKVKKYLVSILIFIFTLVNISTTLTPFSFVFYNDVSNDEDEIIITHDYDIFHMKGNYLYNEGEVEYSDYPLNYYPFYIKIPFNSKIIIIDKSRIKTIEFNYKKTKTIYVWS